MKKLIKARHAFAVGVALFTLVAIMLAATSCAMKAQASFPKGATFTTLQTAPSPTVGLAGGNDGKLYAAGRRIGGNPCPVWRIDPGKPSLVVVGHIPAAPSGACIANGLALDAAGDIFVAEAASGQVYKFTPDETSPPIATVFGTIVPGEPGALAIAFDKEGSLWVAEGSLWVTEGVVSPIQGRVWKIPPTGGVRVEQFRIPPLLNTMSVGQDVRRTVGVTTLPSFTSEGLSVATGIAFNQHGDLFISDLIRKAIWKVEFNPDGSLKSPRGCDTTYHPNTLCLSNVFIQHPLLGAQIALDRAGNIWSGVPDRNAIAVATKDGNVEEIFRNPVNSLGLRNAADSPAGDTHILEFPNSPVLLDKRFCVSNFDADVQDNSPNTAGELNAAAGPLRGKISCMDQGLNIPGMPLPVE